MTQRARETAASSDRPSVTVAEHLSRSGDFLFRWRSYLPLGLLPLLAAGAITPRVPSNRSGAFELSWEIGCALVAAAGVALRMYTVGTAPRGTSGRNTRRQKAELLNTTGAYSVVRHPLYVGNYIIALGLSLFTRAWFVPIILSLAAALYYERIAAREEQFLEARFGAEFRAWAARVPGFVPALRRFRPAALPFSWRIAVVRECYAVFEVVTLLFALDIVRERVATGRITLHPVWTTAFVTGTVFFLVVRLLKKRTTIFRNPRRD